MCEIWVAGGTHLSHDRRAGGQARCGCGEGQATGEEPPALHEHSELCPELCPQHGGLGSPMMARGPQRRGTPRCYAGGHSQGATAGLPPRTAPGPAAALTGPILHSLGGEVCGRGSAGGHAQGRRRGCRPGAGCAAAACRTTPRVAAAASHGRASTRRRPAAAMHLSPLAGGSAACRGTAAAGGGEQLMGGNRRRGAKGTAWQPCR